MPSISGPCKVASSQGGVAWFSSLLVIGVVDGSENTPKKAEWSGRTSAGRDRVNAEKKGRGATGTQAAEKLWKELFPDSVLVAAEWDLYHRTEIAGKTQQTHPLTSWK